MKDQILKLRSEGKSYREIQKAIGCSKGTISYHCGDGQKEKHRLRVRKRRGNILLAKMERFKEKGVYSKYRDYKRRIGAGKKNALKSTHGKEFTLTSLVNKIGNNPKCYLTARIIDLSKPSTFSFDHILPAKIKIDNTLKNLGLSCKDANMAKSDMTLDNFVQLCKEVCENFGYVVKK